MLTSAAFEHPRFRPRQPQLIDSITRSAQPQVRPMGTAAVPHRGVGAAPLPEAASRGRCVTPAINAAPGPPQQIPLPRLSYSSQTGPAEPPPHRPPLRLLSVNPPAAAAAPLTAKWAPQKPTVCEEPAAKKQKLGSNAREMPSAEVDFLLGGGASEAGWTCTRYGEKQRAAYFHFSSETRKRSRFNTRREARDARPKLG